MHLIVFHYANIRGNMGIPGVIQKLIADLRSLKAEDVIILGSDLYEYYSFDWVHGNRDIESRKITILDAVSRRTDIFFPWVKPVRVIFGMLRQRVSGSRVILWPWGLFARQQALANWNGGKKNLLVKKIYIFILKKALMPLAEKYLMMSNAEIGDSGISPSKCAIISMGKPSSLLFDAIDQEKPHSYQYGNMHFSYVGRGMWKEKGIDHVVAAATCTHIPSPYPVHCFVSSEDRQVADYRGKHSSESNLIWHSDVFGADLLPWIRNSVAFITVNQNPTPLRSIYESLYAGTPVIVAREQCMDAFREALKVHDLAEAIQIISPNQLSECLSSFRPLAFEERKKLSTVSRHIISGSNFAEWLLRWLENPAKSASYPIDCISYDFSK